MKLDLKCLILAHVAIGLPACAVCQEVLTSGIIVVINFGKLNSQSYNVLAIKRYDVYFFFILHTIYFIVKSPNKVSLNK